ncbi:MAG: hypothetical protein IPK52_08050 [Chloroflexi bacterium]|nr:hypothetical protein [Chloroflexota bacterium]
MNISITVKRTLATLALSALFTLPALAQTSAPDIITGAGNGGGPLVAQGGVNIAVGDINGDGTEIVEETIPPAPLELLNPEASCADAPDRELAVGQPSVVYGTVSYISLTLTPDEAQEKLGFITHAARPNTLQNPVTPHWISTPWGHPSFVIPESLGGLPIEEQMEDGFIETPLTEDMAVEITSGPICTTRHGLNSYGEAVTIVMTWWKGNLPEAGLSGVWLAESVRAVVGGDTHLKIDYRLIHPAVTAFDPLTLDPCGDTGGATFLYAGLDVTPARGAMNVRSTPNGDIIGRFNPGDVRQLAGTPECAGGTLWWPTMQGGFIAEFAPPAETTAGVAIPSIMRNARKSKTSGAQPVALLVPAIQKVRLPAAEETPAAEQPPVVIQQPVIVSTPTPRPERPTDPTRPTEPADPTRPTDPKGRND